MQMQQNNRHLSTLKSGDILINKSEVNGIANRYYDDIYRFCLYKLRNPDDAMDVTQEVFLLFQQKGHDLVNNHIRAWLFSVADKKIKDEYKHRKSNLRLIHFDDMAIHGDELLTELDETNIVSDEEIELSKTKILAMLSLEEQKLFKLIYQDKLKYNEIARLLNISEKAVNVRAFRMRSKIAKLAQTAFIIILIVLTNFRKII